MTIPMLGALLWLSVGALGDDSKEERQSPSWRLNRLFGAGITVTSDKPGPLTDQQHDLPLDLAFGPALTEQFHHETGGR